MTQNERKISFKEIYVITGGPGFGKSRLTASLAAVGYLCSSEFARDIIEDQTDCGGDALPWKNVRLFQQEVLKRRVAFFESVEPGTVAFADRAIPDQMAYARYRGFEPAPVLKKSASQYRYAPQVFVTPPWAQIYTTDHIRKETFEEATKIHQAIVETYAELTYEVIDLPFAPVAERVEFILRRIGKK